MTDKPIIARDLRLLAADGTPLAGTLFEPTGRTGLTTPLCLVIINSDAGVKREYYRPFSEHLAARGCAVLTYDYRGVGGSLSGDVKDSGVDALEWGRSDMAGAIDWAQKYIATLPVFAIAHGVSGQLVGLVPEPDRVNEYLFIAAGLANAQYWPKNERMRRSWRHTGKVPMLVRTFGALPRGSLGNREELPGAVAMRLVKWARHEHGAAGVEQMPGFDAMTAPVTAYSFNDDEWTSPLAASALLDCYPNARSVHIPMTNFKAGMEEVGHHGFFAPSGEDQLWPRATEWLRREIPLVMEQREAAENAERAAQGLPPKPTKQELARVTRLRASISEQAAKKAAEAAEQAEREAAEAARAAEEAAQRPTRRRRGRRQRDDGNQSLATGRAAIEERRAQRASRRRAGMRERDEATPATATKSATKPVEPAANPLKKITDKIATVARGEADKAAASGPAKSKDTGLVDGVPANAEEARRQAAAIARMAKAGEAYANERELRPDGDEDAGNKRTGEGRADRFRRVPSRRDGQGVKDTDVE
ncbi:MAG: hypothetical protein AAF213_11250 [Pseudomonadota bacterium]